MKIWLNDEIRDSRAAIDAGDRGFLLGDGAFETIYVENGKPAFLAEHLARLRFGLGVLQIPAPAALASLGDIIRRLAAENSLQGKASARITVTRGSGRRGLAFPSAEEASPTLLVTLSPFPPQQTASIKLHLTQRRRFSGAATARFKAIGGYADNILAFNEAVSAGAGEAIMLNEHGRIAGAAAANLFAIDESGAVITPSLEEGALPGVVRALLLSGDHGAAISEGALSPEALQRCALFITNSLKGVVAAHLSAPLQSPVLQRLQTWYQERLQREIEMAGDEADL